MTVHTLTAEGFKIAEVSASGPASDVTVSAGSVNNVDLTISSGEVKILAILALKQVSGLPDDIVLSGITFPDNSTLRLTVRNVGTSDVTVSAESVSAKVIVKAL